MDLREDPRLEGKAGGERLQRHERPVLCDYASLGGQLAPEDLAVQALALPIRGVRAQAFHFLEDPEGHDRDRDDLRMRVGERGAGSFPVILEDLDVLYPAVRREIVIAFAIGPQDALDLWIVQRREMAVMVR